MDAASAQPTNALGSRDRSLPLPALASRSVTAPDAVRLEKWKRWIHDDIRIDVVRMYWRRKMWRDVTEMVQTNPLVAQTPSTFWGFHNSNYVVAQAVAIRRQADRRKDVCSLRRLLQEILTHTALLPGFEKTTAQKDIAELEAVAKIVKAYVDDHVAHDAATPKPFAAPTVGDLHRAIDTVAEMFERYALTLTGGNWMLADMIQDDWRAVFRHTWIARE